MHATAGAGKCAEIVPPLEHRAAKFAAPLAAEATNNQMIRATAKAPSPPPPGAEIADGAANTQKVAGESPLPARGRKTRRRGNTRRNDK